MGFLSLGLSLSVEAIPSSTSCSFDEGTDGVVHGSLTGIGGATRQIHHGLDAWERQPVRQWCRRLGSVPVPASFGISVASRRRMGLCGRLTADALSTSLRASRRRYLEHPEPVRPTITRPEAEAEDREKIRGIASRWAMKDRWTGGTRPCIGRTLHSRWHLSSVVELGRVGDRDTQRLVHDAGASAWCLMKVEVCSGRMPSEPRGPGVASRRLCIVCRDRHLSGEFVASFTTALGLREEFEIIVDRRRGDPPADPPLADRRYQPHIARALERDGFAIVAPLETRPVQHDHLKLPQEQGASPIERPGLTEADERQLLRILGFNHRGRTRRRQQLILTGLIGALLALLMLSPVWKTLVSRTRSAEPPLTDQTRASLIVKKTPRAETRGPRPGPSVAETLPPNPEVREPTERDESPETGRLLDADSMRRRVRGPTVDTPTTAMPAPTADDSPRTRVALKAPSLHVGLPQVDVTRNPAPTSEGGSETYAVRLSDSGGRPLAGAEVLLQIRTADGTLLDVSLAAGPDLGTYSVTMSPLQSAPVDLRLRVVTHNTRVEIPLAP